MNQIEEHVPEQEAQAVEAQQAGPVISGFWRRLGAFFLDVMMLGVLGQILGYFFFDELVAIGPWGRLLGWTVCVLYLGLMNSRLGGGQTLGKRLLRIVVVDRDGKLISVKRSLLRSGVLLTPLFLNGAQMPIENAPVILGYLLGLIVFAGNLVIIYLFIFNRGTRQNIHDMAVRTFVINKPVPAAGVEARTWTVHYAVSGMLCMLILLVLVWLHAFSKSSFMEGINQTRARITEATGTSAVSLMVGQNTWISNGERSVKTHVFCQVFIRHKPDDMGACANEIADIILDTYPPALGKDRIRILITRGYDIGIAKFHRSNSFVFSPGEWIGRITKDALDRTTESGNPGLEFDLTGDRKPAGHDTETQVEQE